MYPRLVQARWKLECSKAVLDGQPAPAEPTPGPLFPSSAAPVAGRGAHPAGPGAPLPAPHAAQPLADRRGDHRHHGPRLPRVGERPVDTAATAERRRLVPRPVRRLGWWRGSRGGGRQSGSQSRPPISMGGERGRGMGDR